MQPCSWQEQETFAACGKSISTVESTYPSVKRVSELKRPERDVYHSPPTNDKLKNEWSYTSAPSVSFHDLRRDNLAVLFFTDCIAPMGGW